MKDPTISLSVESNKMQNKNCNYNAMAALSLDTKLEEDKTRQLTLKESRQRLKDVGLTKYQIKNVLDCFETLDVIRINNVNVVVQPVRGKYVTIPVDTIRFCLSSLSADCFKTYCYLKSWYQIHKAYEYKINYFFSRTEILQALGYQKNAKMIRRINEYLLVLKDVGLIEYSKDSIFRKGRKGRYTELYKVNDYANAQKESVKETIKDIAAEDWDVLWGEDVVKWSWFQKEVAKIPNDPRHVAERQIQLSLEKGLGKGHEKEMQKFINKFMQINYL